MNEIHDLRVKLAADGDGDYETLQKADGLINTLEAEISRLQQKLEQVRAWADFNFVARTTKASEFYAILNQELKP